MAQGKGLVSRRGFIIGMAAAAASAGGLTYGVQQLTRGGVGRQEVPEVVARRIAEPVPAHRPPSPPYGGGQRK